MLKITYSDWVKYRLKVTQWLAVLGQIWILIELGNIYKGDKFYFYLVMLLTCFIGGFIQYKVELYYKNRKPKTVKVEINDILERIKETIHKLDKDKKNYELKIFKWRIVVEENKLKQINSGNWVLKSLKPYGYSRYIFSSILNTLEAEDTYTTLSNLDFWSVDKFNVNDFINENTIATDRGVIINRIIIVDYSIFENPISHDKDLKRLEEAIKKLSIEIKTKGKMNNYFYLSKDYKNDIDYPVPYAVISNNKNNHYIAISPDIASQEQNPKIEIKLYNKHDKTYNSLMKRYEKLFNSKEGILINLIEMKKRLSELL